MRSLLGTCPGALVPWCLGALVPWCLVPWCPGACGRLRVGLRARRTRASLVWGTARGGCEE
ncbi:hypothetical protein FNH04_30425, partial [Streptomyces phyllanthi]|nr:hypothetical protein [Streptomyces phyllanthi]